MPPAQPHYDPNHYAVLSDVEDRHFWFQARNRIIATIVQQTVAGLPQGYRVLEIGCGSGNVLRILEKTCTLGSVLGMDFHGEGFQIARRRTSCPLVRGDIHAPPFRVHFDVIGLFDVIEHIPKDGEILKEINAMLAPGGVLLITAPAHPCLWSYFDEVSQHCRRYTPGELERKLLRAGFRIEYLTQFMMSIAPLVWLRRRLFVSRKGHHAHGSPPSSDLLLRDLKVVRHTRTNAFLSWLLCQETRLIARRLPLPVGTSLLAIARKET